MPPSGPALWLEIVQIIQIIQIVLDRPARMPMLALTGDARGRE